MDSNKLHLGHRKRLREKFVKSGASALNDYEILELLLTYSIPVKDVKPVSKKLIKTFGSIADVFDAEITDLLKVDGIGLTSVVLIKLVKDIKLEYRFEKLKQLQALSSSSEVYSFAMDKLAGAKTEKFMVIYLNSKNKVLDYKIKVEGTVTQARIYPREIIKEALEVNSAGLIVVHNHPSGDTTPSNNDLELTKLLKQTCETMDIRLLDHIIVGKEGYRSCL